MLVALLLIGSAIGVTAIALVPIRGDTLAATINGASTMPITLVYQHKDSHNLCVAGAPCPGVAPDLPHAWDHVAGDDGVYGTADDCPHCSAYSVPAAVSMLAAAYGRTGQYVQQDRIYDNGKSVAPEVTGDNTIQTHGVGMYDGSGGQPDEVQDAVKWALGVGLSVNRHGSGAPLTATELDQYITTHRPVLWVDRDGWPANQSVSYPSSADRAYQGHAKVISGYDDNNTVGTDDDRVLVYDPWPEYNDIGFLPTNATPGPGGTFDPYWLPVGDVNLTSPDDVFFVSTTSIPEFTTVLVPVVGILLVAAVARRARSRRGAA